VNEAAYRLVVAATAERALARLPAAAAAAVVEFMLGALVEAPARVGHPLRRERIDHRADVYRRG
jgi:mRNA interferase RelE/StbE